MAAYGALGGRGTRGRPDDSILDKLLDAIQPALDQIPTCCASLPNLLPPAAVHYLFPSASLSRRSAAAALHDDEEAILGPSDAHAHAHASGAAVTDATPGGTLKINGRSLSVLKLLAEGGFSFVYLAREKQTGRLLAIKKMRCDPSTPALSLAMHEIACMRRFRSPYLIPLLDSYVEQQQQPPSQHQQQRVSGGGFASSSSSSSSKLVYLVLPYYASGNVQDRINAVSIGAAPSLTEREALHVLLGTVRAVKVMHRWRLPDVQAKRTAPSSSSSSSSLATGARPPPTAEGNENDGGGEAEALLIPSDGGEGGGGQGQGRGSAHEEEEEDDDDDDELEDGELDGTAYPPRPRKVKPKPQEAAAAAAAAQRYTMQPSSSSSHVRAATEDEASAEPTGRGGEMVPYAHRDIKPANIMLAPPDPSESADASSAAAAAAAAGAAGLPRPILMDLGSCIKARVHVADRRAAVREQDRAAEHSSMAYRAPELFDVRTGTTLDEKVDIWSLGCTLYAMLYLYSPFETPSLLDSGGSVALAVMNGHWHFPRETDVGGGGGASGRCSERTREVVRSCLAPRPEERPDVERLEQMCVEALEAL